MTLFLLYRSLYNQMEVVLYRVPDPKEGGGLPKGGGGPHVKQNPRKEVLNFLEDPYPRIL